jgi:hypothetical protein
VSSSSIDDLDLGRDSNALLRAPMRSDEAMDHSLIAGGTFDLGPVCAVVSSWHPVLTRPPKSLFGGKPRSGDWILPEA